MDPANIADPDWSNQPVAARAESVREKWRTASRQLTEQLVALSSDSELLQSTIAAGSTLYKIVMAAGIASTKAWGDSPPPDMRPTHQHVLLHLFAGGGVGERLAATLAGQHGANPAAMPLQIALGGQQGQSDPDPDAMAAAPIDLSPGGRLGVSPGQAGRHVASGSAAAAAAEADTVREIREWSDDLIRGPGGTLGDGDRGGPGAGDVHPLTQSSQAPLPHTDSLDILEICKKLKSIVANPEVLAMEEKRKAKERARFHRRSGEKKARRAGMMEKMRASLEKDVASG